MSSFSFSFSPFLVLQGAQLGAIHAQKYYQYTCHLLYQCLFQSWYHVCSNISNYTLRKRNHFNRDKLANQKGPLDKKIKSSHKKLWKYFRTFMDYLVLLTIDCNQFSLLCIDDENIFPDYFSSNLFLRNILVILTNPGHKQIKKCQVFSNYSKIVGLRA